jgi:hypothetical protein
MSQIQTLSDLMDMEVGDGDFPLVSEGPKNAVITGGKVGQGPKGPFINLETTVHGGEYHGSKVWKTVSFSEKSRNMPGGLANLVQVTKPDLPLDTPANALPAVLAEAILSTPVEIDVYHEQVKRGGIPATNLDGSPELRAQIKRFDEPAEEFISAIEAEAAGQDEDLPF